MQVVPSHLPPAFVKLVAVLLLCVQGLVSFAAGQVLCIQLGDCGMHENARHTACGDSHSHEGEAQTGADECHGHQHGPLGASMRADDDCRCHLHVPVPSSKDLPSGPRGDNSDLRLAMAPLFVAFVLTRAAEPPREVTQRFKPPDFSVTDQVLALKTARLLI